MIQSCCYRQPSRHCDICNKRRFETRSVRYIGKISLKTDILAYLKSSATYRYQKTEIQKLSKKISSVQTRTNKLQKYIKYPTTKIQQPKCISNINFVRFWGVYIYKWSRCLFIIFEIPETQKCSLMSNKKSIKCLQNTWQCARCNTLQTIQNSACCPKYVQ